MSQPASPPAQVDAVRYAGTCDCGRTVTRSLPAPEYDEVHGIHVRCARCRTTVWCERDAPAEVDG